MFNVRKLMAILVALLMVVSLVACGGSGGKSDDVDSDADAADAEPAPEVETPADDEPAQEPADDEKLVFGNIAFDMTDVWNMYSVQAFEYAAEEMGVEVITLDAGGDLEKSVELMESLIQKEVDGVSLFPISPEQAATLSKMANDANIPITFENLKPGDNVGEYVSCVACEYDLIGEEAIKYIAETWPGAKVLFVAGAKGGGIYETYQDGVDRALESVGDKVEIVDVVHGDWETEKSMNVTQDYIQSGKEFDVIFANNEQQAKGCMNALIEAGLEDEIKIVSTGGGVDGLDMIRNGELTATISAPVSLQGLITFRNLYRNAKGKTDQIEKFIPLPVIPVDESTIDSVISWEVDQNAVDYIGGLE